jgi:homoserine dehydrogenase
MIAQASSTTNGEADRCAGFQAQSRTPHVRTVRIALLGSGTVGGAVARLLIDSRERLRQTHAIDINLTRILVRDAVRPRAGINAALLTNDFNRIVHDRPDVVIEALGGREPAAAFVSRCLQRGISVVSANKTLIAHDGPRLEEIAHASALRLAQTGLGPSAGPPARTHPRLVYEASVGAAIPVLAALRQRQGDPLITLRGVLNGTCNFILSRMSETGAGLNEVLREAIARGLAEPDPSADISGRDTSEKLCILARAAGFAQVTPRDIPTTGIENVTPRDLQAAREHGCVIRLIAEFEIIEGQPRLRVGPALIPATHPLAKASGAENVLVLDQEYAGRLVLHGEGAGPRPTAAAILGDVLNLLGCATADSPVDAQGPPHLSQKSRRLFVRVAREHPIARGLLACADDVQVRRDALEAVVNFERCEDPRGLLRALADDPPVLAASMSDA